MYSLAVNDFFMVAHSLKGEEFGVAQNLHGATFEITTEYKVEKLNYSGVVIDVTVATEILKKVTTTLNYKNLDELKEFKKLNTTMEVLCEYIHNQISKHLSGDFEGTLKVVIKESPLAHCSYENKI
ncbi:MAG: 6-carboxytetrahydropterin synthase [SAR86 cluster bacterium]|jgi:6-pyruvoyl-tetrahydropterin synthase|nr:6-carboxytetrahydropterin synthase [SAR86 cluster bacterium]HIC27341.1 6-carboxytetrahydropterin synthase [Gammaproteobacteria bacterium]